MDPSEAKKHMYHSKNEPFYQGLQTQWHKMAKIQVLVQAKGQFVSIFI